MKAFSKSFVFEMDYQKSTVNGALTEAAARGVL